MKLPDDITIPEDEIEESFTKVSGPGGQHANKVETGVRLRFDIRNSSALTDKQKELLISRIKGRVSDDGVIEVVSSKYRSQWRNRVDARRRLHAIIQPALAPPKPRKRTKPTAASRRKRLDSKRRQSEKKQGRQRPDAD